PYVAIQVIMMPKDTNPVGSIFGGVILSYLDQAGAIGARREIVRAGGKQPFVVTVAMNKAEVKQPVMCGDVVRFLTRPLEPGRPRTAGASPPSTGARGEDEAASGREGHVVQQSTPVLRRRGGRAGVGVARADADAGGHRQLRRAVGRLQPDPHRPRVRQDD